MTEEIKKEDMSADDLAKTNSTADASAIKETGQAPGSNKAAAMAAKMYGGKSIVKTVFKITFPVFILMIVNSLYQMVDTIMAAQLVDYGSDWGIHAFSGSIVMQYIMPTVMLCMASTVLINVGYGTMFSQKMGAGDTQGAKASTSTALWATTIVCGGVMIFSIAFGGLIIDWNMPSSIANAPFGDDIRQDAYWTNVIYALAIFVSGYQGVVSRQLRAEGHIKSMAYLPLISIPFNIFFDWLFMGALGTLAVGAAYATIISMFISTGAIFIYARLASKKETTLFAFNDFLGKFDAKIFLPIVMIGIVPFFMQFLRIYDIQLAAQGIKHLMENIPSVSDAFDFAGANPDAVSELKLIYAGELSPELAAESTQQLYSMLSESLKEVGNWTTFFTAAMRPMMLIMMPGVAVLQGGSAYLGYHYGAKNFNRVNKGIGVMILVMLTYALPSWILLLILSKNVLFWFGATNTLAEVSPEMIQIHRIIIGLSIANCFVMAPNAYFISTKRFKPGLALQLINLVLVYTIVIVSMYFAFSGTNDYMYFYTYNAVFMAISAIISMIMLGTIVGLSHNKLKKEGHVDTHTH